MIILSERLVLLRTNKNLAQKRFASLIGVSESSVQHYELGMRNPNIETLVNIANFFDVSLDYLVGRSDDPKRY